MADEKAADFPSTTETQESSYDAGVPEITPRPEYKLVFLDDQGVGKTSIITHFAFGSFDYSEYTPQATVGFDFLSETVHLEDRAVEMQLWDIAGQEHIPESSSLIPVYIRDASVAVVVYDITNRSSFLSTSKWVEAVRTERGEDIAIMLIPSSDTAVPVPKEETGDFCL
ncbi:Rab6 family gtpase, partial [Globisporangium splendens]